MKIHSSDASLAHALARWGLGINIALHGWTRLPKFAAFQNQLQEQFAASPLPNGLVNLAAYGIVATEAIVGTLLLLGLWLRPVLVAGTLLMCVLLFGVCLIQNWGTASTQMIYLAFFAVLLATAGCDRYSVDYWRAAKSDPST